MTNPPETNELTPPPSLANAGSTLAPSADSDATKAAQPVSYKVGDSYDAGIYLGRFDLEDGEGLTPIFVVKLTEKPMTFEQTIEALESKPATYDKDWLVYNPIEKLRAGETVIAPVKMIKTLYYNRHEGLFEEMLKPHKNLWVLSGDLSSYNSEEVDVVDFYDGGTTPFEIRHDKFHSVLVRPALTL